MFAIAYCVVGVCFVAAFVVRWREAGREQTERAKDAVNDFYGA